MMELAKIMTNARILALSFFAAVTGEEQGIVQTDILRNGQSEKWNIVAMLNNDMIGNSLSSGTRLSNNTKGTRFLVRQFLIKTEDEARCVKATNSDNDSPSGQRVI
jgi:hypothetical protein